MKTSTKRPNIVLIVVDDAGFMDFGGYGGEALTPNIDQIASADIRFTNYHTSPLCAPSRAMLLTGLDNHRTGIATIPEVLTEQQAELPGYSMSFVDGVKTVADKLKQSGYQTYMTGKWHLGSGAGDLPDSHGFDRSFALDASGADNWEQKSYVPYYDHAPWYEDGEPATLPEDFYSSRFIVDKMIDYLKSGDVDQPFFSYLAFQAIHIPVQAPREYIDHYEGVYLDGWDALLQRRFQKAKELGLISESADTPVMNDALRPWDSLSEDRQAWFERAMMVNAGMLEAMDFHIGRLVDFLMSTNQFDNTVFIITSDNGPEFSFPSEFLSFRLWMFQNGYSDDIDRLGQKGSMVAIGPEWASAASSPGNLFKFYAAEGGTHVPLIVAGPGVKKQPFNDARAFVTDVTPTILDLSGVAPEVRDSGEPMIGHSLGPLLRGEKASVYSRETPVGMEVSGNAALFKGEFKLTKNTLPHGDGSWRLHQLSNDPAERVDLSATNPEKKAEMLKDYHAYESAMGVLPVSEGFDINERLKKNLTNQWIKHNSLRLIGILLGILIVGGFVARTWVHQRARL